MKSAEDNLLVQILDANLPEPQREHKFHPVRRWRFDFAWPEVGIAVEVEGGVWNRGRHVNPAGFTNDCTKYNTAASMGWYVFRFPTSMVKDGTAVEMIKTAFYNLQNTPVLVGQQV